MENSTTNGSSADDDYKTALENAVYNVEVYSMVALSVIFVLGTVGNGLVIWFVVFKMKKTVNSIWFLSLAIADFTFSLFQPLEVTQLALNFHWPFGAFMCKLANFVQFLNMFSSVLQLAVISIDRCVCVVFPAWCAKHRTTRLALKVVLGLWVISAACSVPFFMLRDIDDSVEGVLDCKESWIDFKIVGTVIMRSIIFFALPLIIIVFCYTVIIVRIRKDRVVTSKKTFWMIAAVVACFFICWMPYHIFSIMWVYSLSKTNIYFHYKSIIGLYISGSLAFANSVINPFLYVFFGRDFKEKFWSSIPSAFRRAFNEDRVWRDPETHTAPSILSSDMETVMELSPQNS